MRRYGLVLAIAAWLAPAGLAAQADSTATDSAATPRGVNSRTVLRATTFRTFFNDAPEQLFGLVPGVVLRGTETGLASAAQVSIRGGVPGAASVYIDGAPVRFLIPGIAGIGLGAASLSAVAITTGVPDLSLPDVRDGVIEYSTRSGGERLAGSLAAATDEGFEGVGYNRFAGGLGGPLPLPGATWFVGGTLAGQRQHYLGLGSENVPNYITSGIDTTITHDVGGQTQTVTLPSFVDQRAYDWATELRGHAKVELSYGAGSRVSLTGVVNEVQQRFYPDQRILAPSLYTGARSTARLLVANWQHTLGAMGGKPLTLRVNASLGSNQTGSGILTAESERATMDPALGITLETLQFTGAETMPSPVTDQIIRNVRVNSGLRVPLLNRDDLRNIQTSRMNPYGMENFWMQQGLDGSLTMSWERRTDIRAALDWELGTGHRFTVGADFSDADVSLYQAGLLRQTFMDVYRSDPGRVGVHVADKVERGPWRAELGVRYDHFGSTGLFARVPGRIYSNPEFNRPAAINTDTGYTNSLARVMTPGQARNALSLRAAVEHAAGERTTLRASVGRWVEPPTLGLVLMGSNSDLDFTNTNDVFGRDVDYRSAFLAEVRARHDLSDRLRADLAVYHLQRGRYIASIVPYDDPANPGDVLNVNSIVDADGNLEWGFDAAFDGHVVAGITGRAVYGLRLATSRSVPTPFGPTESQTIATHAVAIGATARATGGFLAGLEASALFRLTSGLPYTRLDPLGGSGALALRSPYSPISIAQEPLNSSLTPWTRHLDMRIAKTTTFGRLDVSAFADLRNALNITNVLNLFAETGDVVNVNFQQQALDVEFQNIESEAANNSRLLSNGDIVLGSCSTWTVTSGQNGAVVNCVALQRAEARFGNGDGLYSVAERQTTLNAFYNQFFGPQTFYGAGRSVRLGVEIRW